MHWNGEVGSLERWMLQKILIILNNGSNKSYSWWNFLQKTLWQISLSTLEVELKGFTDLPFFKYYNAQEWECIFTLGQNTLKDIDYIEK